MAWAIPAVVLWVAGTPSPADAEGIPEIDRALIEQTRVVSEGSSSRQAPAATVLQPTWVPLKVGGPYTVHGPGPITGGQVEGISSSPVSGAVEAIAAHPTTAGTLWIGAINGGIFRTDNATAASPTWTAQTDSQASLSIAALELDPTDTSDPRTLVAGIGRQSSFGKRGGARTGLLRTTDGGTTWAALSSMATRNIAGLAPRDATIVAAVNTSDSGNVCSQLGIWRSTDTGASFSQISNGGGLPCGFTYDLASDPTDTTRLFTPVTGLFAATDGIYRSTDTGATWTQVSSAAMDLLLEVGPSRVEIAVGTAGGATANVYVAICASGRLADVFRSGDAGATWVSMGVPTTDESPPFQNSIHPGGQCGTHLSLVADPSDANTVYIGGDRQSLELFPNSLGAINFTGRLFRGVFTPPAGPTTWRSLTHCSSTTPASCPVVSTTSNSSPHADSREMVFDAAGNLIETDDGGVYRRTVPAGVGDWFSANGDLPVNEQHNSAYDTNSNIAFSGNQDVGSAEQSVSAGVSWRTINQGDGGDVAVAVNDPLASQSTRYSSAQNFSGGRRQVFDASNALQSSTTVPLVPLGGDPAPTFQFTTPIAIHAADPTRLILGGGNGVFESMDRFDTVDRISTATINASGRNAIAYGTAGNMNVLYYGSGDDVYVRTAAPPTAPSMTDPDASSDSIAGVVIDPDNALAAFAIDTDQVFRTTNAGAAWSDVTGDLGSFSPGTLRSVTYVTSAGGDGVIVGTNAGVYLALESAGFSTWDSLGTGLPNAPVFDLHYDPTDDILLAGTLGRGAFTLTPVMTLVPVELTSFSIE